MTKTLTEQWRDGTLPDAEYYVKNKSNTVVVDYYCELTKSFAAVFPCNVKEVLEPVPSYKEYNKLRKLPLKCFQLEEDNSALMVINKDMCKEIERLKKQLAIATKALKRYEDKQNWDIRGVSFMKYNKGFTIAHKAIKEMEGVK